MAQRDISAYTRPRYIESPPSETKYVGTLKTPSLTLNGDSNTTTGLLTWGNISEQTVYYELFVSYNGGEYELYDDNIFYPQTSYQLPSTLEPGVYKFKIRAGAIITDPDTYMNIPFYSAWSEETFEFTVVKLNTPVLSSIENSSLYYWDDVPNTEYYELIINRDASATTVRFEPGDVSQSEPYVLYRDTVGRYVLVLFAKHSNAFLYHSSDVSNSLVHNVIKLSTPEILRDLFTPDPPVLSWSASENSTGYDIYLNDDILVSNYNGTSYNFLNDIQGLDIYSFSAKVRATHITTLDYPSPKYLISDFSSSLSWGLLPTPELRLDTTPGTDNRVYIDNYNELSNAEYIEVYDSNKLIQSISIEPYMDLTTTVPRSFNIRMKAVSNDPFITDSALSNQINYIVSRLATPVLTGTSSPESDVITLSWNSISNADKYNVYLNNELIITVSGNTYNITNVPIGNNIVYITAVSNYYKYLDSNQSNLVRSIRNPTSEYLLKINNQSYEAALPFVFTETLDETMDTASISTTPLTFKTPFEAYSEVDIIAASVGGDDNITEYKQLPGFPKHMILSQDEVEEICVGTTSRYIHHLNLIERTKLLETELMPDFSITQPMEFAQKVNELTGTTIVPDYGGHIIWKNSDSNKLAQYTQRTFLTYAGSTYHFIDGLNDQSINGGLYSLVNKGDNVYLPYETATSFDILYTYAYFIGILTASGLVSLPFSSATYNSLNDYGIKLKKRYKYRLHTENYDEDPDYPETEIGVYTDNIQHVWDTSSMSVGLYDIILEVYLDQSDLEILRDRMRDNDWRALHDGTDALLNTVPNFMYSGSSIPTTGQYEGYGLGCVAAPIPRPGLPEFWDNTSLYRVVWKGINITNIPSYNQDDIIPFESKSIKDAIDKALKIVKPIGTERYSTPKYSLDPKFSYLGNYITKVLDNKLRKVNYYPAPELKFQNQKSLYEVLLEIGRLFYGIPRLGCYDENNIWQPNMITFDVLDQSTIDAANKTTIQDQDTLETVKSTIDNHNTGFISDLSNIVNNEYYTVFPAGNLWTTPRSGSENDPLANKDNMALVLDRPIYRVVDVLVKNFDPNDTDRYISIKNFVNEYNVFQSLNNDAEGKGLSLYYSQGSNKIEGLGQIPQNSQIQAVLGLSATDYIISVIIQYASGNVGKGTVNARANNLQYKILYVPYVDSKVYTEQANISGLKNHNYKAFNQENNIITDNSFGKSAQTQVERLGNNSIEKPYVSYDLNTMPRLGTIKEFEGYKYYVDTITYHFNNSGFVGTASYSKNFNKINERVGIDAMYRLYRIYADDFIDRSININRYCYLSKTIYSNLSKSTILNTSSKLVSDIGLAFNNGNNVSAPVIKPDSLYIRNMKADGTRLQYNAYDTGNLVNIPAILLPVNYNIFGNSISFSAEMKDNFSAGITTAIYDSTQGRYITDIYNEQRVQHDARYVDTNGEVDTMGITLFRYDDNATLGVSPDMYPIANYITSNINRLSEAIYSEKIKVIKDNRERLKFNYQLHFQTFDKNITIHSGLTSRLFKNDLTYTGATGSDVVSPSYVLFRGDISKQDKIGNTKLQTGDKVELNVNTSAARIRFNPQIIIADGSYDGYALVWPSGEIIYSYRTPIVAGSYIIPALYLNFSDNKVSYKQQ